MKCVRELFKEGHHNNQQIFPLSSDIPTLVSSQHDCNRWSTGFSELDSFLLNPKAFDDFIPELVLPPYYEPLIQATPIKQENTVETSCHSWRIEPLSVNIASESSFQTNRTYHRVTPSKCLLQIAPNNQRLPDKIKQYAYTKGEERSNETTRVYPYVPKKIARRKRTVMNSVQLAYLEERFHLNKYMNSREAVTHGQLLGVDSERILVWFQNRRARQKKKEIAEQQISNKTVSITPTNS